MRWRSLVAAAACALTITSLAVAMTAPATTETMTSASGKTHAQPQNGSTRGQTVTKQHANGPFEVKLVPQGTPDKAEGSTLARMSLDKQYHGGLEATAKGEMLTAGTDVQGSAGYVAIERVIGTLNGRTGSFVLHHCGMLTRGTPSQNITVVPDSGSGQLAGITGELTVIIEGGKHSYEFEYRLPQAQ